MSFVRYISALLIVVCANIAVAEGLEPDVEKFKAIWGKPASWKTETIELDEETLNQIIKRTKAKDPFAVERFSRTIGSWEGQGRIHFVGSKEIAISLAWLERNGEILLVRLFYATVNDANGSVTTDVGIELQAWLSELSNEPITMSLNELVVDAWEAYLARSKNSNVSSWINATKTANKVVVWGVPPDFVEIVVTAQPECEFLPTRSWFLRQICL